MSGYAYSCVSGCFLKPEEDDRFPGAKVADMWVLMTEFRSSTREKSALISPFEITIKFYSIYKI